MLEFKRCLNLKLLATILVPFIFVACSTQTKEAPADESISRATVLFESSGASDTARNFALDDSEPEQLMEGDPVSSVIPPAVSVAEVTTRRSVPQIWRQASGPLFTPKDMPEYVTAGEGNERYDTPDAIEVHSLNIGAGSCHIVDCPGTELSMIVDCGSMSPSDSDMTAAEVKNYIQSVVSDEYILVLTHPDRDHVNLVSEVTAGLTPKSIWLGSDLYKYNGDIAAYIDKWHQRDVPIYHGWEEGFSNRGKAVEELQCGDVTSYILTVNVGDEPNSESLVLLAEHGNFRAIFSGDAHGKTEKAVMNSFGSLTRNVTLLTASHHGAITKSSNHHEWTEHVEPQVIVYSSGTSHGHPNTIVTERYRDDIEEGTDKHPFWSARSRNSEYEQVESTFAEYVTEVDGVIVVESDGETYSVTCSNDPTCFF